jgi:hypothetical protein
MFIEPAAATSSTPPAEASTTVQPFLVSSSLTPTMVSLSMLLKSIHTLEPVVASARPPLPRPTALTASLFGSIDSTSSHDSATALGESLNSAPWPSSPLACARLRSVTTRR